ncbi:hypothetical protein ACFQDN_20575 [Pseudomonas asuensis]|uniref:Secreted protein n=1 Tax=Pseudomonas asuensis TaxID=1825787 RepID=A0ABQ2H2E4_9PSED|nr:hypothetical protein [Pseudomonas asuensis]GGM29074.1 hypothetical protein GCM10009425_44500 [Pseudomonas asuensis]
MVSLLLALGWLVTAPIREKEPSIQEASAKPTTSRQWSAFRAAATPLGSSSSGADLTTLATLAILSDIDKKPVCTEAAGYSSSSCGGGN